MSDKTLQFSSEESLATWLCVTTPGKAILNQVLPRWSLDNTGFMEAELRAEVERRLARRASCLVVCHPDGLIQVYGDQLAVHFADVLDLQCADPTNDEGEHAVTLAEEYAVARLPERVRNLLLERSAVHYYDRRTPEEEKFRLFQLACFRAIPRMKEQETERLRKEVERREELARQKYPEGKLL